MHKDELKELIEERNGPCVSLYMPTHRALPEAQQDPIRFRNLLTEAENQLRDGDVDPEVTKKLLRPARQLHDDIEFWRHQSDGLAVFIAPGHFRYYRLPVTFDELVVVTSSWHLKPLLPMLAGDGNYYLLALSQKETRLFAGTRFHLGEIFPENLPQSMTDALPHDDPEKQLQFHTRAPQGSSPRGRASIYHGHGVGVDDTKDRLLRYFRAIDQGLRPLLKDKQAPLLLAGVEYLQPIYREANSYPHLLDDVLPGNPERLSPEELHAQAWSVIEPLFRAGQEEALAAYREMAGTGRTASAPDEVIPAAINGRIAALFVALGVQLWGKADIHSGAIALHAEAQAGDRDLLDLAAVHTLLNGGAVFAVQQQDVPSETGLAAIYRY